MIDSVNNIVKAALGMSESNKSTLITALRKAADSIEKGEQAEADKAENTSPDAGADGEASDDAEGTPDSSGSDNDGSPDKKVTKSAPVVWGTDLNLEN